MLQNMLPRDFSVSVTNINIKRFQCNKLHIYSYIHVYLLYLYISERAETRVEKASDWLKGVNFRYLFTDAKPYKKQIFILVTFAEK